MKSYKFYIIVIGLLRSSNICLSMVVTLVSVNNSEFLETFYLQQRNASKCFIFLNIFSILKYH